MKKYNLYIFKLILTLLLILLPSCCKAALEETDINDNYTDRAETSGAAETEQTEPEIDYLYTYEGYDIPYPKRADVPFPFLLEEMQNIFNEKRELFEKIKEIGAEFEYNHGFYFDGLRESGESPYDIYIDDFHEEIYQGSIYEPVLEIFSDGRVFRWISLNNVEHLFGKYLEFCTQGEYLVSIIYYYDYEPEEKDEHGNLNKKLDGNWYYKYVNMLRPPC